MDWKKWLWVGGGGAVLVIGALFLDTHLDALQSIFHGSKKPGGPGSDKLNIAEVRGKLEHAELIGVEVKARLSALDARCQGELPALLDDAFLSDTGVLSVHPMRKEWFALRRDIPEWTLKHDQYLTEIHKFMHTLSATNQEEASELADESLAWSALLDKQISKKIAMLPKFDAVARQLLGEQPNFPRRNKR